jgi:phosphatidate cytidylyltransferase
VDAEPQAAPAANPSDLGVRAAVGGVLAIIALLCLWAGGWPFQILVTLLSLLIAREWARLTGIKRRWVRPFLMVSLVVANGIAFFGGAGYALAGIACAGGALAIVGYLARLRVIGWTGLGLLYAGLASVSLIWLRGLPEGFWAVLWVLGVVIATDTCAYFAGRRFGGPKLAPTISPKKTWSGLIGGMVGAAIAGGIVVMLAQGDRFWLVVSLSALAAIVSQSGDLFESWLKRRFNVKDSGGIFPGHGGAMDRVDGVVALAPLVALAVLIGKAGVLA